MQQAWVRILRPAALAAVLLAAAVAQRAGAEPVVLTVATDKTLHAIDERIYGQFLEHIYHSIHGGLWGETVWNRSFEEPTAANADVAITKGLFATPAAGGTLLLGNNGMTNADFTVEVRRTADSTSILVGTRAKNGAGYVAVLGTQVNTRHELERTGPAPSGRAATAPATAMAAALSTPGKLDAGRWYTVRLRTEGTHIQAFLDGQRLFDIADGRESPVGAALIGSRAGTAEFRNARLTTLEGTPIITGQPTAARYWQAAGAVDVAYDRTLPLNSKASLKIAASAAGAGIQQDHFCVRTGDTLRGSLWYRGTAPEGLTVQLLNGNTTLASTTLPACSADWKEYPIELTPAGNADEALLQVLSRGQLDITLDQVTFMPDSARATGGYRPDLLQAIADMHPAVMRWPGGSFVGEYNWKNTIGPQKDRIGKAGWSDLDPLAFGIDEFIPLCRKTGADPIIVVPIRDIPDVLQSTLDFIEYCNGPATTTWGARRAANGHPDPYHVTYWELGNEEWSLPPQAYVDIVKQFAPAMKKADPLVRVIACGSGSLGRNAGQGPQLDQMVIEQCADLLDFLSIHHYAGGGDFSKVPLDDEAFWQSRADLIAKSKNPDLKLFDSEWNAGTIDWRTGLYAGNILIAFEHNASIAMTTPALFLRNANTPAADWNNAFINITQTGWFPAPNYVVMKFYRDHFAPQLLETRGTLSGLTADATRSADGGTLYFKAANPTAQPADIQLNLEGAFKPATADFQMIAPDNLDARNSMASPHTVQVVPGQARLAGSTLQFTLPRWSVGIVTLKK